MISPLQTGPVPMWAQNAFDFQRSQQLTGQQLDDEMKRRSLGMPSAFATPPNPFAAGPMKSVQMPGFAMGGTVPDLSNLPSPSDLAHRNWMSAPKPGLPFGSQRQRPGQSAPGMDPAGQMWNGPDASKANFGAPILSATFVRSNPLGVPVNPQYLPAAGEQNQEPQKFGMGAGAVRSSGLFSGPPKSAIAGTAFDTKKPTYDFDGRKMADGGTVRGPGGPTDDAVPALVFGRPTDARTTRKPLPVALSNGEEIIDAATRDWFGKKFFLDLKRKAAEGMKGTEDADEATEPHGAPDRREDAAEGEMDDSAGYATGGTAGGFPNPYADDPMASAQREQEAKDARLAAIGGVDFGGGRAAFENKYGYGFTTPMNDKLAPSGPPAFETNGGTSRFGLTAKLEPVPDIVPAGNPAAAPSLPFDRTKVATDFQNFVHGAIADAPANRAFDFFDRTKNLALQPKGSPMITVPDASWKPAAGSPAPRPLNDGHFLAPWEKEAQARAERDAPIKPFLDAGMRRTDIRRLQKSGALMGKGQPTVTPEMAKSMGLKVKSMNSRGEITYSTEDGKEEQGFISQMPGPMITDPITMKKVPGPDIPILVNRRTGAYRHLTPEGGTTQPNPSAPSSAPGWQSWLDTKLGSKK